MDALFVKRSQKKVRAAWSMGGLLLTQAIFCFPQEKVCSSRPWYLNFGHWIQALHEPLGEPGGLPRPQPSSSSLGAAVAALGGIPAASSAGGGSVLAVGAQAEAAVDPEQQSVPVDEEMVRPSSLMVLL